MDRRHARLHSGPRKEDKNDAHPQPAQLSERLLTINERLEHLLEIATVLLVGAALTSTRWSFEGLWLAPLLFLVIRPLAVAPVVFHGSLSPLHKVAIAWFGIRGIGSIYYLMYAIHHGLPTALAEQLIQIVLTVVAISVVVHGVSPAGFKRALN
jgi:NhaP-type Na+/H+ or K+/H+ antiporter